jgi:hypothetical protein
MPQNLGLQGRIHSPAREQVGTECLERDELRPGELFQLQRLAELPLAAVLVEGRYSALYKLERVNGSWLADQLARLEVRYPEIHLVFSIPYRSQFRPGPRTPAV